MLILALAPCLAQAVPAYARQTGQNCQACHAGGQFPELTPYGRLFKMTGYTLGRRALPLSVMAVASSVSVNNTSKSDDPGDDFQKRSKLIFATGSVFLAGKVTDNLGLFSQFTYDNYGNQADDGSFQGTTTTDNVDIRYADHLIMGDQDLIWGISLNNNPSISDPWNAVAAWMQYVPVPSPSAYRFVDGEAPYPGFGSDGNIAGLTAYLFWNQSLYAELGFYRSADRIFSPFRAGITGEDRTYLDGNNNPYWRLAYSRDWGANSLEVGASGMVAHIFDPGAERSDHNNLGRTNNTGVDSQYQYLLFPHAVTVQLSYMHQVQHYSQNSLADGSPYFQADGLTPVAPVDGTDTTNVLRLKASYIYQAKYGASLSYFSLTGSTNSLNQSSGYDSNGQITSDDPLGTGISSSRVEGNLSGDPETRGFTGELFWTPIQYLRLGLQYTAYNKYNGASHNYDGFGRNASDNNTLFFYAWAAY
ncbi:cytochrome C [Gallaecimonas kandeliae]|uniref:cytochrome C n=1 Tax=Gallaecimonas kandeliae TaxID=3029055 RepID=UPI00264A4193|nr:cytochrome C [Gallaecimonas kandeliae]WKE64228.1 cytochrome C [Gallaecimonas kandeliae]